MEAVKLSAASPIADPVPTVKGRLSRQLLIGFGVALATVGVATLGINSFLIQTKLQQELQEQAQSITQGVGFSAEGLIELGNQSIIKRVVQNYATLPSVEEVAIVAPSGATIARSGAAKHNPTYAVIYPELAPYLKQSAQTDQETSFRITLQDKPVLVQILPFSSAFLGSGNTRGLIVAILDVTELQKTAWQTLSASTAILLIGMGVILALMTVLIQRTVLTPLQQLNQAITDGDGIDRFVMPDHLPDNEIKFLATTIQSAATRIEAYQKLELEIAQRQQAEAALLESEAQLRQQAKDLEQALLTVQQAQMHMIQSEKMSALGNLVAGVAHEINNPVGFLKGSLSNATDYVTDLLSHVELYQSAYPKPDRRIGDHAEEIDLEFLVDDLPKLIVSMQNATERVQAISDSLRIFSRADSEYPVAFNLHDGLDSTVLILKYRLKANDARPAIEVVRSYAPIPNVVCFPGQLNQVFMNILANAIDALEEANQGRDFAFLKTHPNQITIATGVSEDGRSAIVRIRDNGAGMTEEVKERMFDQLFTTKAVGKGTGLGLAIAYQVVVEKHQGSLDCISSPNQGTEFTIRLPIQGAAPTESRQISATEGTPEDLSVRITG